MKIIYYLMPVALIAIACAGILRDPIPYLGVCILIGIIAVPMFWHIIRTEMRERRERKHSE